MNKISNKFFLKIAAVKSNIRLFRIIHSKLQDIPDPDDISTFLGRFQWHLVFDLHNTTQELINIDLVVDEVTMYETDRLELGQQLQQHLQALGSNHQPQ